MSLTPEVNVDSSRTETAACMNEAMLDLRSLWSLEIVSDFWLLQDIYPIKVLLRDGDNSPLYK